MRHAPLTHVIDETDGTQCGILIINTFFVECTKMTWDGCFPYEGDMY